MSDERTTLTTLTEAQANVIGQTYGRLQVAIRNYKEAKREFDEKLALLAPTGANGFDIETMTFYSQPPEPPKED